MSHPSISERKYVQDLVGFLVNQGLSIPFSFVYIFSEGLDFEKLAVSGFQLCTGFLKSTLVVARFIRMHLYHDVIVVVIHKRN